MTFHLRDITYFYVGRKKASFKGFFFSTLLLNLSEQVRASCSEYSDVLRIWGFFLKNVPLLSLCGNKLFNTFSEGF